MNPELITIVERTLPYLVGRIPDSVTQSLAEYILTGVVDQDAFNIDARNRLRAMEGVNSVDDKDCSLLLRFAVWLVYTIEYDVPNKAYFHKLLRQFCEENNIPETT